MAQNTRNMSVDGVLTTKSAARFVTSYLLFQSCLVIFTISSYLRCMVYHVTQIDTDTSKIISISTLWEIVLWNNQNMYQGHDTGVGNDKQLPNQAWNISQGLFPSRRDAANDADQQLKVILQSYVSRKSPALHMYSGMLDSRFVMHDEIQKYLEETVAAAFPWKLQIESLDSAILLYSLSLACIGFMYYTIYHKIMTNPTKNEGTLKENMHGDLLLFDSLYWFNLFFFNFIMLDMTAAVTIPILSAWQAMVYTALLHLICYPSDLPKHIQMSSMMVWALHVLMQTSFAHVGIGAGGVSLICHIIMIVFCYISLVEDMDVPKFLNLRAWSALLLNVGFLFVYVGNVEFITGHEQ